MIAVGVSVLLGACAGGPPEAPPQPAAVAIPAPVTLGEAAARHARAMVGVPYRYGGAHPSEGFDCSGLVHYAYAQAGLRVPRVSQQLFRASRKISLSEAVAGDLIFFQDQEKLSHVGLYLGDGLFVHSPTSGRAVSIASIEAPYYQEHMVAVGRLIPHGR